jgi:hypothetical protein
MDDCTVFLYMTLITKIRGIEKKRVSCNQTEVVCMGCMSASIYRNSLKEIWYDGNIVGG